MSENRYIEQQNGRHQTPVHMYPYDHNSSVPPMYQITPPTPYFPDMSLPRRNQRGRLSSQPTQPSASVFQSPPGIQARRYTHGYLGQLNEYSDRHSRRRLSQPQEYVTQPDEFNDRLRGRLSPQPTQHPARVVQPPPGIQARRDSQDYFTQENLSQPVEVSGQHGYRRLSRANVGQHEVQRSDQGFQYLDPDFHLQPTERKQGGRVMSGSEVL